MKLLILLLTSYNHYSIEIQIIVPVIFETNLKDKFSLMLYFISTINVFVKTSYIAIVVIPIFSRYLNALIFFFNPKIASGLRTRIK